MQWTDEGIVLGVKRHGETSAILELMTREQLRAPGGSPRSTLEHRNAGLASSEGLIERRQIGDLQGDDDDPGRAGGDIDRGIRLATEVDRANGQQGSSRLQKSVSEVVRRRLEH